MDSNDGQTGLFVGIMPTPQLRNDIAAVDSAKSPEFDQDDSSLQSADSERLAVEPILTNEFRGAGAPLVIAALALVHACLLTHELLSKSESSLLRGLAPSAHGLDAPVGGLVST